MSHTMLGVSMITRLSLRSSTLHSVSSPSLLSCTSSSLSNQIFFFSSTVAVEGNAAYANTPLPFLDYIAPVSNRTSKPTILIKGATIGSLTLALALQKRKFPVTLLDKSPRFKSPEPGVFLPINATLLLNWLGVRKTLGTHGHIIANKLITDESGVTKHKLDLEIGKDKDQHNLTLDANDFFSILTARAKGSGVDLQMGVSPTSLIKNDDRTIKVHFSNDRVPLKYDLVVAADGLDSKIKKKELSKFSTTASPKFVCYKAVIDREYTSIPLDSIIEMRGKNCLLTLNPFSASKVLVAYYERDERASIFVHSEGPRDVETLIKKIAQNFNAPMLNSVIGRLNVKEKCVMSVPRHVESYQWVKDRIVILGSAAHSMYPYHDQSAAMDIEDAFSLAANLDKHEAIDVALEKYFDQRLKRVIAVQQAAKTNFEQLVGEKEQEREKGRVGRFMSSMREKIPLKNPFGKRKSKKEYEGLKKEWEDLVFHSTDPNVLENTLRNLGMKRA